MTKNRDLKHRIRELARKTGKSYTAALWQVRAGQAPPKSAPADKRLEVLFEWGGRVYVKGREIDLQQESTSAVLSVHRPVTDPSATRTTLITTSAELRSALGRGEPLPPLALPVLDGAPVVLDEPGLVVVFGHVATGMTVFTTLLAASMRDRCTLTRVGNPDGGYSAHPANWAVPLHRLVEPPDGDP